MFYITLTQIIPTNIQIFSQTTVHNESIETVNYMDETSRWTNLQITDLTIEISH